MAWEVCKKPYCVWWVYGFLRKKERDLWVKWGAILEKVFREEKLHQEYEPPYHFHWKARCTNLEFFDIWQSPATAAIFWVSHGHSGFPLPYDYEFENRDPNQSESVESRFEPKGMVRAGGNLRVLTLISCESSFHAKEWKKLLHPDAVIKTFVGIVEDSAKPKAQINEWMRYTYPQHLHSSPAPQKGARYMLRNLTYVGPAKKRGKRQRAISPPREPGGCSGPFSLRTRMPGPAGGGVSDSSASLRRRGPLGYS